MTGDLSPLHVQLVALMQADTLSKLRSVLEKHPELLSDAADAALADISKDSDNAVQADIAGLRLLLERCRVLGIDAGIEEVHRSLRVILEGDASDVSITEPTNKDPRPVGLIRVLLASWLGLGSAKLKCGIKTYKAMLWLDDQSPYRAQSIDRAIKYLKSALAYATPETLPNDWAIVIVNYASAYLMRITGSRAENLEECIRAAELGSRCIDYNVLSGEWASSMLVLGSACLAKKHGGQADNIDRAIKVFEEALSNIGYKRDPVLWTKLMNSLGSAYGQRVHGDKAANTEKAIQAYEGSIRVLKLPTMTRTLLGVWDWEITFRELAGLYNERMHGDPTKNRLRADEIRRDLESLNG